MKKANNKDYTILKEILLWFLQLTIIHLLTITLLTLTGVHITGAKTGLIFILSAGLSLIASIVKIFGDLYE